MKNLKLQLMALGLITISMNMLAGWDFGNIVSTAKEVASNPAGYISDKLRPAADALAAAENGVNQGVNGLQAAINQLGSVPAKIQSTENQVAAASQQAQQAVELLGSVFAAVMPRLKAAPEGGFLVGKIHDAFSATGNAFNVAASSIQMGRQGTRAAQDALSQVNKVTGPMRSTAAIAKDAIGKLQSVANELGIESLKNIAKSLGRVIDVGVAQLADLAEQVINSTSQQAFGLVDKTIEDTSSTMRALGGTAQTITAAAV